MVAYELEAVVAVYIICISTFTRDDAGATYKNLD